MTRLVAAGIVCFAVWLVQPGFAVARRKRNELWLVTPSPTGARSSADSMSMD